MTDDLSFKKNVLIPFGQSVLIGALIGGSFAFVLRQAGREHFNTAFVIWFGSAAIFFGLLSFRMDGKEKPKTKVYDDQINVSIIDDTSPYMKGWYIELEVSHVKMVTLAKEVMAGKAFTHANFGGRGRIFSRIEFEDVRKHLLNREVLRWKNEMAHSQGIEITRPGRAFFRYFSEKEIAPLPQSYAKYERRLRSRPIFKRTRKRAQEER